MRHFRMSSQNIKNLTTFKKQVGCILKEINKFDEADKNKAITYLKKCINSDKKTNNSNERADSHSVKDTRNINVKKQENGVINHVQKVKEQCKTKKIIRTRIRNNTFVKSITFRCKVCDTKKRSIINFLKHLNTHVGTPISCTKCKKSFNGRTSFEFHITNTCGQAIATKKTFKCTECNREFKFKRHLYSHLEGHKRNNCKYCDTVFTNKKYLIKHLLENHSLKSQNAYYKCGHCDKRYVQKRSLYCHLQQHVPNKNVCMDCGLIIEKNEDYKIHVDMHYNAKKWECPRCEIRFVRKQHLLIHLKKHDLYKCKTCNSSFSSKAQILQHKRKGHIVEGLEPKMMCPICPKIYYRSFTLQQHMKKHKQSENCSLYCKYCNKTFSTCYHYYKHCRTVAHEKNCPDINQVLCEICGKNFNKKYLLDDHVYRSHSKKEMLSCLYCDYKTTNKTNMKRHNSIHLPPEDYICEQCGKHFSNIFSLKEHVSYSHIQVKQFNCDECDKSFKRKSELVRHKKIHSDERPYVCQICGSSYKRNNHLKRHEENVHKIIHEKKNSKQLHLDNECIISTIYDEKKVGINQSIEVLAIPVGEIIQSELSKNIDQNLLNQQFWNNKQSQETFNNLIEYQSININDVDQLVASYMPEKQPYYQEYDNIDGNVTFETVSLQDVILSETISNINQK